MTPPAVVADSTDDALALSLISDQWLPASAHMLLLTLITLIVLFAIFMIRQHRHAHETLARRLSVEENQRTLLQAMQASVAEVKVLKGILPICASCKRIRGEGGGWEPVEAYVRERTGAEFSYGLCPDCAKRDWG